MKIIDLLNKIANGEEVPKKIKYQDRIYHFNREYMDYESDIQEYRDADVKENYYIFSEWCPMILNEEVEILDEEDEFEDIEEITIRDTTIGFPNGEWTARNMDKAFAIKINQLIKNQKKIIERLQHENSKDNV